MQDLGLCKVQVFAWAKPKLTPAVAPIKSGAGKQTSLPVRQVLRIMKLSAIIILTACLQVSAKGYSQKITLSVKDAPLEQVFKSIEKQSGFYFNYIHELMKQAHPVTIQVKNANLEEVLAFCFKGQPLDYTIVNTDKLIIIKEKQQLSFTETLKQEYPPIDVRGIIIDENGAPVQGVNITVKGTSKGTSTNMKGEFVISNVDESAILVITSIGYDKQEVLVKNKSLLSIKLKVAVGNLDEIQVIAYGTTTRRLNTGNVSTIKADAIGKQSVNNPLLALEGRVPGLIITPPFRSLPGADIKVQIRGRNSLANGNDPFYVIDGVPYTSNLNSGVQSLISGNISGGSPLHFLNPADIESIEILKDADATSIYGSRAANGAILITTKKGKAGKAKYSINIQNGRSKIGEKVELLNTQQYLEMRREAFLNDGIMPDINNAQDLFLWDTTRYTDWQKELIAGTAKWNDIQASVSGGNAKIQYLIGSGYHRETTIYPGDFADEKGSLHFNVATESENEKLRISLTGNYMIDNNRLPGVDLTTVAILLPPNAPSLFNSDGSLNWFPDASGFGTWDNPLAYLGRKYKNRTSNLLGNSEISYKLLTGLQIKSSFGYTNLQSNQFDGIYSTYTDPAVFNLLGSTARKASFAENNIRSWIIEPQVSYNGKILGGEMEVLLGMTIQESKTKGLLLNANGFTSDLLIEDVKSAPNITIGSTNYTHYKYNAFFGRLKYFGYGKYLVSVTVRRDGSSRFGPESQFHNFWATGIGWIFTKEKLFQRLRQISFGKLRLSYGTTGSDQIPDYQFMDVYRSTNGGGTAYQGMTGLIINNLYNPHLAWEETRKFETGIELGFFNDRVTLSTSYFLNRSSNQLIGYKLPSITGALSVNKNLDAKIENSGFEFTTNAILINSKSLKWTTNFNLTIAKNRLISVSSNITNNLSNLVGKSLSSITAYRFMGVDPITGKYQVADESGNPTFTPNPTTDQTVNINLDPKYYGGIQNSILYKGVQLDFLIQVIKKIGQNNNFGNNYPGSFYRNIGNEPLSALNRWTKPGDNVSIQRYNTDYSFYQELSNATSSDAAYSDASVVTLKNISLSWLIPQLLAQKFHLQSCRLYIQGQNLLSKQAKNQPLGNLFPLRSLTAGIQLNF